MCNSLNNPIPELQPVIAALKARQSVLQLKVRLLKGMRTELQAARDSGLTWLMIWQAMREAGYPGAYPNFCRTAKALTQKEAARPTSKSANLPSQGGGKGGPPPRISTADSGKNREEKPEWQRRREEAMAKLDREAERNRERELRLARPKVFNPPPFVGRGE